VKIADLDISQATSSIGTPTLQHALEPEISVEQYGASIKR